jgi:Mce-associated membrane protein
VLVAATVLVLVVAATAGLLTVRAHAAEQVEAARPQAQAAAEAHAVTVLSYDHRHLDRDFRRARATLTGPFADEYAKTTEKVVRPTAEQVKAGVTASVAASSVVRAEADRVVVLLFVDQTTTSTRLDEPKVDLTRVRMTLDKVTRDGRDRWLVSGIDAL